MRKFFLMAAAIMVSSFLMVSCSDDDDGKQPGGSTDHPELPESITLPGRMGESYPLDLKYNGEWQPTSNDNWLNLTRQNNILLIRASVNNDAPRTGTITITAEDFTGSFQVIQEQSNISYNKFQIGLPVDGISDNGRYIVGTTGGETYFYDRELGFDQVVVFSDVDNNNFISLLSVSNDGTAVGSYNGIPAYYKDGQWTQLRMSALGIDLDTYEGGGSMGEAFKITNDSKSIVGTMQWDIPDPLRPESGELVRQHAMRWDNFGDGQLLAGNYLDPNGTPIYGGYHARDITPDGSKVMGHEANPSGSWIGVVWTPEFNRYSQPFNKMGSSSDYTAYYENSKMSPNGRYTVGTFYEMGQPRYAAFYDFVTEELTVIKDLPDALGHYITDSGVVFLGTPHTDRDRTGYVYTDGELVLLVDWLSDNYGLEVSADEVGTTVALTPDESVMIGFVYNSTGFVNYFITLK